MKTATVSDFTETLVRDQDQMTVIVWQHPLLEQPVQLDAAKGDLAAVADKATECVVMEVVEGDSRWHVVLELADFDALFRGQPDEVLSRAPRYAHEQSPTPPANVPKRGEAKTASERVDYTARENFGLKHRGRCRQAEAELVRNNLDQANANRRRENQEEIDPNNEEDVLRYGFPLPSQASADRPSPGPRAQAAWRPDDPA